MANPSKVSATGLRKADAHDPRSDGTTNGRSSIAANDSHEAQGERAYERIHAGYKKSANAQNRNSSVSNAGIGRDTGRRLQHSTSNNGPQGRSGAERLAHVNNRRGRVGTQNKSSFPNQKAPTRLPVTGRESGSLQRDRNINANRTEQDALAEAISRSLADKATSSSGIRSPTPDIEKQYEANLAKAKLQSLIMDDESSGKQSSGNKPGPASTSNSDAPHAPLRSLLEDLDATAKNLDTYAEQSRKVAPGRIAEFVREWEGTVLEVFHALAAAENQRIKDIKLDIALDRELEEKHQKKLQRLNEKWEAKMTEREKKWEKRMEEQKQMYEAQLAEQKGEKQSTSNEKPTQPPVDATPSYPAVSRLQDEIRTPKEEQTAMTTTMGPGHAAASGYVKPKINRWCNANVARRNYLKVKNDDCEQKEGIGEMKKTHEAWKDGLNEKAERLTDTSAKLSGQQQQSSGQGGEDTQGSRSGSKASPGKRKLDDGVSSRPECAKWSPKKSKNGI